MQLSLLLLLTLPVFQIVLTTARDKSWKIDAGEFWKFYLNVGPGQEQTSLWTVDT